MDDLAALTHQLEYQFIKTIIHGLETETISVSDAKVFSTEFLALEPFVSDDDASGKIAAFYEMHKDFRAVKEYMEAYDKERVANGKINTMRKLIKENNIDEALSIAKK